MTFTKSVDQTTILQGDRTKLKDLLRLRLNACGWSDQVRLLCRDAIKDMDGTINCDSLVQQVTPKARALIPDTVKKELLQKIKTILIQQEGIDI
ncbi:enhancer of yellow 2 transcription factor [Wyeomyia smithii]|uniref:enhancer of yellow 2 transcription factor n=1 Tax=Wyeomyia smithii TaxID=174621 RepID=UPI002467F935|nr:enhancer of yellow 2 transcription factor [Wyeomyia smithii]